MSWIRQRELADCLQARDLRLRLIGVSQRSRDIQARLADLLASCSVSHGLATDGSDLLEQVKHLSKEEERLASQVAYFEWINAGFASP
ncbi:unnamed protein product [Protopolystoma xenopodis]|uniref:Uncharacterized protein n=1 Tax=Protopolystoma xenopodis TaxID=117903 RepID=A0A3S5CRA9_9PLAT|nr:unnamed protein product [Protopolystoma xenopodis]